jgi:Spy/CpxP family protein refolding chaperone
MKMNRIILVMVLGMLTTVSVFAQREDGDRNQPKRPGFSQERMERRGNRSFENELTADQKKAIKEIRLKAAKESKPLKYKLKELKAHQETLMNEDQPNLNAINANIDEMSKLKNQLAKIKAKTRIEVLSQLTDEQKLLFSEKKPKKMRQHFMRELSPEPPLF